MWLVATCVVTYVAAPLGEAEVYFVSAAHGVCEHRVPPWGCTSCGSVLDTALCSCWRSFRDQCSWSLSPQDPRVWRLGPPLSSPRTSLHQPDVPGFTVGSSLLRMDDSLCGSRVLEPLVCHPFSVGISLYTLLSPSSLRTCPERCCSIVYYDC